MPPSAEKNLNLPLSLVRIETQLDENCLLSCICILNAFGGSCFAFSPDIVKVVLLFELVST